MIDTLNVVLDVLSRHYEGEIDGELPLFGQEGVFDSLELVDLVLDIEDALSIQGHNVTITDERAMSQKRSPFRTAQALTDYIDILLEE